MYLLSICLLTILISMVQSTRPTINLSFSSTEKYLTRYQTLEIQCEILNPNARTESAQLWYIDLKTGKRVPVSRTLLTAPADDSPEIFKGIRNRRYEYVRKNHIKINSLQMEDSAKYECNCPDCEEVLPKQTRDLYVMKTADPVWDVEGDRPLHENTKAVIRCKVNDFYPYVGHKILRNNKEITNDGKSSLSNRDSFPQNFVWEATVTPTADWHNSTLRCIVTEGNTESNVNKTLDVLFAAQFVTCAERQFINLKDEQPSLECSYSGNPQPRLTWLRRSDQKSITLDNGITINTKDEQQGRYKSIVTFNRNKLISIPLITTNGQGNTSGENYYQQLLNNGFMVKLTVNGNEKGTRHINIVHDANQVKSKFTDSSPSMSFSVILLACVLLLHIIQH